jgi:hypothetical protein
MPAAKPTKKTISTRTTANEASLPSHNRAVVIGFRTVEWRGGLFDASVVTRSFENSDSDDGWAEFIGIPHSCVPQKAMACDDGI